jgi:hypothetical protein
VRAETCQLTAPNTVHDHHNPSTTKRPPAFYETRKVSIVRVSLWDATPSSVAETSDSEAITAVSTKIPALCNPTLCRRVLSDASNDQAACIFKGSQILLRLIILEYEDGTMLRNVGKHPETWLHIPQDSIFTANFVRTYSNHAFITIFFFFHKLPHLHFAPYL